jgi:hypothetical protein
MQTLGISDSTPRSESRLKSLFWPSIESGADVDYLALQGYWVCTLVAALSFVFLFATGQPISGIVVFLLFHLGGVGVREHSRFAATIVFAYYIVDTLASFKSLLASPGLIVLRVIVAALFFSNLRATLIATRWRSGSDEAALPFRFDDTLTDKVGNKWPAWLWPKIRVVYYIFSIGFLSLVLVGLTIMGVRFQRAGQ